MEPTGNVKRQVAILGPTPEFVRWSIRQTCPLRQDTDLASVDQTEKRLQAVREAGLATARGEVYEGIAIRRMQGRLRGFRVHEVFEMFGGEDRVRECCGGCLAQVPGPEDEPSLAGCFGWLPRTCNGDDLGQRMQATLDANRRKQFADMFLETNPVWYGLWAAGSLQDRRLRLVSEWFRQAGRSAKLPPSAIRFSTVLQVCLDRQMTLDVELIPPGHSDGLDWTIGPHCPACKAPFGDGQTGCRVCGKSGQGHPRIRRKVRGLRPWVDLRRVLEAKSLESFRQRHGL
jgi:hypothetical protein